jgi:aminomethyltransferase
MPLFYTPGSIVPSVKHTREKASLFDVSHMGQLRIDGKHRNEFIEHLTMVDTKSLREFQGCYSLFTNDKGGIIDDTIITNCVDHLYVVVNAGCYDKDIAHIRHHENLFKQSGKDISVSVLTQHSLIALQGPLAEKALQNHTPRKLTDLYFFNGGWFNIDGTNCYVQRSGYTGEDGFEISIPTGAVDNIARGCITRRACRERFP